MASKAFSTSATLPKCLYDDRTPSLQNFLTKHILLYAETFALYLDAALSKRADFSSRSARKTWSGAVFFSRLVRNG